MKGFMNFPQAEIKRESKKEFKVDNEKVKRRRAIEDYEERKRILDADDFAKMFNEV